MAVGDGKDGRGRQRVTARSRGGGSGGGGGAVEGRPASLQLGAKPRRWRRHGAAAEVGGDDEGRSGISGGERRCD